MGSYTTEVPPLVFKACFLLEILPLKTMLVKPSSGFSCPSLFKESRSTGSPVGLNSKILPSPKYHFSLPPPEGASCKQNFTLIMAVLEQPVILSLTSTE